MTGLSVNTMANLNEVLSIRAQELCIRSCFLLDAGNLNEVLSIRAQE